VLATAGAQSVSAVPATARLPQCKRLICAQNERRKRESQAEYSVGARS
jgi:hypothetical protein